MYRLVLSFVGLVTASCGGNQIGTPDAASDAPVSSGQFTLTVTDAKIVNSILSTQPATNNVFVDVGLTLINVAEPQPLSVSLLTLSLETSQSLVFPAIPQSVGLAMGCPSSVGVAAGGMLSCHVGFEIPQAATASRLVYSDGQGHTAEASISSVAPAPAVCAHWPQTATTACENCLMLADASTCNSTQLAWGNACLGTGCFNAASCPQIAPSSCTVSQACKPALASYQACIYEQCDADCR